MKCYKKDSDNSSSNSLFYKSSNIQKYLDFKELCFQDFIFSPAGAIPKRPMERRSPCF